jgi:DNA-binding transcriptional LysR family regulator
VTSAIDWSLIKTFLAIYRAGSHVDAATELGVDESTVRRRLGQLERILRTRAFVRRDGRLYLAKEQQGLVEHALRMEANAQLFWDLGQIGQRSGAVRISLIDQFAIDLSEDIAAFYSRNPEILLDITTESHIVDLRRDGIDIAVRMARPTQGDEKLRRLGSIGFGIYGSKAYLAENASRQQHQLIALGVHYPHSDHHFELANDPWMNDLGRIGMVTIMVDCYPAMLRLCEAGAGLATLPHFMARNNSALQRFEDSRFSLEVDAWALVRPEVAELAKVRKTVDFLVDTFPRRFA